MSVVSSGLRPINDLSKEHFYIPSYQRGYRWTENQVTDLLDDIFDFYKKEKSKSEYYCLQPIVISKNKVDGKLYVIDGQQRLTTIHIILSYLKDLLPLLGKTKFNIEYQTRPGSEIFLNNIDREKKESNIDFYHIVQAYETVQNWFETKDGSIRLHILNTLLGSEDNNVRVIWYELGDTTDPIEVFTRLNMGKIGLTNSELIKALFLSSAHKMTDEQRLMIANRQKDIASEWDIYETELRKEEFWGFLQNDAVKYDNRIEFLFDLISDNLSRDGKKKEVDKYYTFRHFSKNITSIDDVVQQWNDVKSLFQLLHDWFTDKRFYHLVGFLISSGTDLNSIIRETKDLTKLEFFEKIRTLISNQVSVEIEKLSYQDDKKTLRKVLLLFNVLSILDNPKTNMRFQFGRYKIESWDIEYIHSVSSEMPASKAHQLEWLKEVESYTSDNSLKEEIRLYLSTAAKERGQNFEDIYQKVIDLYSEDDKADINDISNLTLLNTGTNRGYKNAVFPIKRKVIIEKDQTGTFVPLCTKNAFLKYYNRNLDQTTFWGEKDRETYKAALVITIGEYLNGKKYE